VISLVQKHVTFFVERRRSEVSQGFSLARRPVLLLLALVWLSPSGCGQREPLAQVSGQVTFEGEPVQAALILFSSDPLGIHMTADVVEGRYEVVTARARGIPPGEYRVAIAPPMIDHPVGPILEPPQAASPPDIPPRYHAVETSGLAVRLVDGENTADFNMTKAGFSD
jgi:hypothetical protein